MAARYAQLAMDRSSEVMSGSGGGKVFMGRPVRIFAFASVVNVLLTGAVAAQTPSNQPSINDVGKQFKNGANQVGNGAEHIGQGVKQAAIVTWEAIKDGATSFAARFN